MRINKLVKSLQAHKLKGTIMTIATFIALGASAIGIFVFSFCIYIAISASKKKSSGKATQHDTGDT